MKEMLKSINFPSDLKNFNKSDLKKISKEIRYFLIKSLSRTGGHLASNLGVVELTIALHYVFDMPYDKIIWDVGHQSYVHKILTGRKEKFNTLRKYKGLCGFPKRSESEYDIFGTGHSSTSISAALGMAKARDLNNGNENIIAVIGDGSITGGIALEAINNAGRSGTNIIVILNDNDMSISKNVGALSKHFSSLTATQYYLNAKKGVHRFLNTMPSFLGSPAVKSIEKIKNTIKYFIIPSVFFEDMGFKYIGIADGHNIDELIHVLENIKNIEGPVLFHVHTQKGKGYKLAENNPKNFHSVSEFDIKTGKSIKMLNKRTYSDIFGDKIIEIAKENKNVLAITAAMADGTGLTKFQELFPERFFDVAISEQHAVTFSAGLSIYGKIPIFAVYSTFLQRAYDEILHDVCLQNLHVIFCIDRAGLVGADGETHQGIFDIAYLSSIPNITIMSPKNGIELEHMIDFAINFDSPIAIRYPKGEDSEFLVNKNIFIEYQKSEIIFDGEEIAIIFEGNMGRTAFEVYNMLKNNDKYNPMFINIRFIKPIDENMLNIVLDKCKYVFTFEDGVRQGGMGNLIFNKFAEKTNNLPVMYNFGFNDCFVEHGSIDELYRDYHLDKYSIYNNIKKIIKE